MTALFVLLVALQVADAWSTLKALKRPGNYEANPVMRKLMDAIGVTEALVLLKVASCVAIWWAVMSLPADIGAVLLLAACALYAWVIHNNLKHRK